jgi:hypothetical protein
MNIKECPFCGSTDIEVSEILVGAWSAKCDNCDTLGPEEDSAEFATLAWNKGTPRHHEVHRLRTALEQIRDGDWKYTFATPSRDYWMQEIAREALEL